MYFSGPIFGTNSRRALILFVTVALYVSADLRLSFSSENQFGVELFEKNLFSRQVVVCICGPFEYWGYAPFFCQTPNMGRSEL